VISRTSFSTGWHARGRLPAVLKASNFVLTQAGKAEMSLEQFRAEFPCVHEFYDRHTPHVPMPQLEDWFTRASAGAGFPFANCRTREFLEFLAREKLRTFLLSTVHADISKSNATSSASIYFWKNITRMSDKRKKIHGNPSRKQFEANETLFIGDMEHDIETARHAAFILCAF